MSKFREDTILGRTFRV